MKVKPIWILMKQETMEWQWHQLDHEQIICTSLQTGNHASNSSLITAVLEILISIRASNIWSVADQQVGWLHSSETLLM